MLITKLFLNRSDLNLQTNQFLVNLKNWLDVGFLFSTSVCVGICLAFNLKFLRKVNYHRTLPIIFAFLAIWWATVAIVPVAIRTVGFFPIFWESIDVIPFNSVLMLSFCAPIYFSKRWKWAQSLMMKLW